MIRKRCILSSMLAVAMIVMCFGGLMPSTAAKTASVPHTAADPVPVTEANIALGKPVNASSSLELADGLFHRSYLTDGQNPATLMPGSGWSTNVYDPITRDTQVEVTVDLEKEYSINAIALCPTAYNAATFPTSYVIEVSANGTDWQSVASVEEIGGLAPSDVLRYEAEGAVARYVRLTITKQSPIADGTGAYVSQIGEIMVYSMVAVEDETVPVESAPNGSESETEPTVEPETEGNIALGKPVDASSSLELADGLFHRNYLTDGQNPATLMPGSGWSTNVYEPIARDTQVEVTVDLQGTYAIREIDLLPTAYNAGTFPTSYKLSYSVTGKSWKTIAIAEEISGLAPTDVLRYEAEGVVARYIRLTITKQSPIADGTGAFVSQIGEIEVYGTATESPEIDPFETDAETEIETDPPTQPETGSLHDWNGWVNWGFSSSAIGEMDPVEPTSRLICGAISSVKYDAYLPASYVYTAKIFTDTEGVAARFRFNWSNTVAGFEGMVNLADGMAIYLMNESIDVAIATESGIRQYSFPAPSGYDAHETNELTVKDTGEAIFILVNGKTVAALSLQGTHTVNGMICVEQVTVMDKDGHVYGRITDSLLLASKCYFGYSSQDKYGCILVKEHRLSTEAIEDTLPTETETEEGWVPETQPPETETQPSETETQPPETETQPSETETQPSETETQPSETETQPSETETQPSETENRPETQPETDPESTTETGNGDIFDDGKEGGCTSVMQAGVLLVIASVGTSLVLKKRKESVKKA